ncbi:unnamed protein product (macronuclear) [Paramecium tetraurelia]|uniref:Palmitoyltransferase n=1 Tax=Paramecium tetraurelia TaxID=5888 RepID=A0DIP5_PARTE|nr:uncharacterized protein GSPATT00017269001 [Paramecium tetraurelia]CAK82912.1 unnamed protein product [Paramecium tetraurelia]|eukprot:XP_001450309.1 hypothetical protein (macronuclear) [Paramecium tetraurelia strain d4-2]
MQQSSSISTKQAEQDNLILAISMIGSYIRQPTDHSSPENRLLFLAYSNDLEQFSDLLRSRPLDLSVIQNFEGYTVLHYACYNNSYQMCEIIINYQERRENNPLNMEKFINSVAIDKFTPLHFAAQRGNLQILNLLKLKGADLKATSQQGLNIMHVGAQGNQPNSIVFALANGIKLVDFDINGGTALHWACLKGCEDSANYLLPLIEQKKPYFPLNSLDSHQYTPLHLAVHSGNTKLVKKLLFYGADKKIKGYENKTPANMAEENDFKNIYNLLTKKRGFLISFFNLKQGLKRVRKNRLELMRFGGFMIFLLVSYLFYMVDDFTPIVPDYIFFGITLLFFILIVCSNPGYQIRRQEPLYTLITAFNHQDICPICNVVKLPRSKHCDICQRCVLIYDHHCPWINNCVGAENHLIFISFLISLEASLIYALFRTISQCFVGNQNELEFFDEPLIFWAILSINILIEIIFALGITLLLVTQIYNIFLGKTTFERFAVQNQNSTMRSVTADSNKSSLIEDDLPSQKKDRFVRCSCKNLFNFLTNGATQRKKEQAIRF